MNNLRAKLLLWGALWDVQVGLCVTYNLRAMISKSYTSASFGAGFSSSTFCTAAAISVLGVSIISFFLFFMKWSVYKLNTCCRTQFGSQVWTGELEEKNPFRFQRKAGRKCWMPTKFSHSVEREREMSWNWACKVNTGLRWSAPGQTYCRTQPASLEQGVWRLTVLYSLWPGGNQNFQEHLFILSVLDLKDRKIEVANLLY